MKNFKKLEKIVNISINLRVFRLPKHIALEIGHKKYLCLAQDLYQLQPAAILGWSKNNSKNDAKNTKNCNILVSKTPKKDLLPLNYGPPRSFTTQQLKDYQKPRRASNET